MLATTDGGSHWTRQSTGTSIDYFISVSFPDRDNGWGVASYNQTIPDGSEQCSVVFATSDGGSHWSVNKPANLDNYISCVKFIDAQHGWIGGFARKDYTGVVFSTVDGGAHWTPHETGEAEPAVALDFVSQTQGWASFTDGVWVTTDGGATWTQQNLSAGHDGVNSIDFADANDGWAVGTSGKVWATTDGGLHWNPQSSGTSKDLNSVSFSDAQHGFAVGGDLFSFTDHVILATSDGGAHWATQASPIALPLTSVASPDATHAWATAYYGNIISTSDGQHWGIQQTTLPTYTKLSCGSSVKARHYLKITGSVSPAAAPGSVTLVITRQVGRKWKAVRPVKVGLTAGKFSYRFKTASKGKWHFYAYYSGGASGARVYWNSKSSVRTVRVK
jgi:photosystem II stability/assembly factor-like uncharacterized protein